MFKLWSSWGDAINTKGTKGRFKERSLKGKISFKQDITELHFPWEHIRKIQPFTQEDFHQFRVAKKEKKRISPVDVEVEVSKL